MSTKKGVGCQNCRKESSHTTTTFAMILALSIRHIWIWPQGNTAVRALVKRPQMSEIFCSVIASLRTWNLEAMWGLLPLIADVTALAAECRVLKSKEAKRSKPKIPKFQYHDDGQGHLS